MCQGGGSVDEVQGLTTGGTFLENAFAVMDMLVLLHPILELQSCRIANGVGSEGFSASFTRHLQVSSRSFLSTGEAHVLNPLFTPSKPKGLVMVASFFFFRMLQGLVAQCGHQ